MIFLVYLIDYGPQIARILLSIFHENSYYVWIEIITPIIYFPINNRTRGPHVLTFNDGKVLHVN